MSDEPTSTANRPNPLEQVSDAVFRYVVHRLRKEALPSDVTDPAEIALIIDACIADVASMVPANADEANIAVRAVIADAQASACIGYARELAKYPIDALKCRAQANHCHRTANAARALLLRVQSARRKREANKDTCSQDAWTEHSAANLMVAATQDVPARPPPSAPRQDDDDNKFARYDPAEQFAAIHPRRSAEIRVHRGIPATATWGPPEPEIVQALLASTSPIVLQADEEFAHLFQPQHSPSPRGRG